MKFFASMLVLFLMSVTAYAADVDGTWTGSAAAPGGPVAMTFNFKADGAMPPRAPAPCIVEHAAAKAVLRMICARLGVVCKERTATDISPYGAHAQIDYAVQDHRRWNVSFTNTAQSQEFLIEAL